MKEILESLKNKIKLIENNLINLPEQEQTDLKIKLMRINKDLQIAVAFQLAISKR